MKTYLWIILLACFSFSWYARCDVPLYFQFPFGDKRIKRMTETTFFDSKLQIDLARAAIKGDTNRIGTLIGQGADVNALGRHGMRPLFWALINRNLKGFKALLNHGADPNATVASSGVPRENALSLAAFLEEPEYLQELLAHGAKPNSFLAGHRTPLFTATFYQRTNNVSILLSGGADLDWTDAGGNTVLHLAIYGCSYEMALFLYRAGANPSITSKLNRTAIDTITQFGDRGISRRADARAYKELLREFKERGLLENSKGGGNSNAKP
jgi:uncharacterized protein